MARHHCRAIARSAPSGAGDLVEQTLRRLQWICGAGNGTPNDEHRGAIPHGISGRRSSLLIAGIVAGAANAGDDEQRRRTVGLAKGRYLKR